MAQLAMLGGGGGGIMSLMMPMFSSVIGMFMQPGQKEEQGKLNDLKVSTSAYGQGIAIVYGTMRVPGNMFWATQFEEVKRYINSKGKDVTGKKKGEKKGQPVYEYYANYAMGLCEGPVGELLRVWADSNLIYDKYNPDNEDIVEIGFSQPEEESGKMGKGKGTGKKGGSQESGRFRFRFYNGSEDQMPDPHMVAKNLEFNQTATSAHRGLSYLYFEHFALADFGNRTPTITAEVTTQHLRKPIFTGFQSLEKQGITPDYPPGEGTFDQMFFDPVRLKIYTTANGILRQWDMATRLETKRIGIGGILGEKVAQVKNPIYPAYSNYYSGQVKLFNGLPAGVHYPTSMEDMDTGRIIGIAASGDLIGQAGGATNSVPLVFIDPESMVIKNRFGEFGNQLSSTNYSMQQAKYSTIISYFDIMTKTPYYYTVVVGVFGEFYFFNDRNEPMSYWDMGGSIYGQQGVWISPGLPSGGGTSFYTSQGTQLFDAPGARVIRYEALNAAEEGFVTIGQGSGMETTYKKAVVIYDSQPEDDEAAHYITQVYPIMGAEAVGFIEFVSGNTVHPEKNGVFAVKVDYAENRDGGYDVQWRKKFAEADQGYNIQDNKCIDSVILTGHRLIIRRDQSLIWDIDFTGESVDMWYLPADCPPNSRTQFYFPAKGAIISEWPNTNVETSGVAGSSIIVEAMLDRMVQHKVSAVDVLYDLADRVGIGRARIDATKMNDDKITGYVVQQPKAARHVADDLMKVFFFDMTESDYLLKAVSRSQSTVAETILQPDLGFIDGGTPGDNPSDYYKETRVQEIDLPQLVMITYIDPKDDYESGEQHWRRPRSPMSVMQSREKLDINLPMALEADFAKQTAQKIVYSAWTERSQYEFALPWKFLKYDPTDVLRFMMDDGLTFQARMSSMDLGQDFSIRASAVATEMSSYNSSILAQGNGRVIPVKRYVPPFVRAEVFDLPYFEDTDSVGDVGFQYYWGLKAYGPGFRVGTLSSKMPPNGQWEGLGMTAFDMPWGSVLGHVDNPPWGSAFPSDDVSRIRLMPAFDFTLNDGMYEWQSIADENWPSHENTIVINDEIIYFKDVDIGTDGSITIYNLIRGARGTINKAYEHMTGEPWYVVNSAFQEEIESFENVGKNATFRPTSPSIFMGGLPSTDKVLTGASHRPWAPNMIKRNNSGGNVVFTWERSTRLGGQLKDGTGTVPQVDGELEYEFYILNGPYDPRFFKPDDPTTYKRKYGPLTNNTVTYTAAEMVADGVSQSSTFYVAALQRNQFVGRGFPGWHASFPGY
jgi:hypothetical protein